MSSFLLYARRREEKQADGDWTKGESPTSIMRDAYSRMSFSRSVAVFRSLASIPTTPGESATRSSRLFSLRLPNAHQPLFLAEQFV